MYFYFRFRSLFVSICREKKDQEENQGVKGSFTDCKLVARAELSILINETSEEEIIIVN